MIRFPSPFQTTSNVEEVIMIPMSGEANMEAEAPITNQGVACDGRGKDPITDIRYRG